MLKIIDGDIFESGADVIAHQVNCQGVMGSGVAKQVREKFPKVFEKYREECRVWGKVILGECLLLSPDGTGADLRQSIANLFGQDNYGYDGKCYTDYNSLRNALKKLNTRVKVWNAATGRRHTVAIPYLMGCHRGGGDWEIVSKMIEEELTDCDVTMYRYTGG